MHFGWLPPKKSQTTQRLLLMHEIQRHYGQMKELSASIKPQSSAVFIFFGSRVQTSIKGIGIGNKAVETASDLPSRLREMDLCKKKEKAVREWSTLRTWPSTQATMLIPCPWRPPKSSNLNSFASAGPWCSPYLTPLGHSCSGADEVPLPLTTVLAQQLPARAEEEELGEGTFSAQPTESERNASTERNSVGALFERGGPSPIRASPFRPRHFLRWASLRLLLLSLSFPSQSSWGQERDSRSVGRE